MSTRRSAPPDQAPDQAPGQAPGQAREPSARPATWRAPTRRAFVGMIGAAAAALAIRGVAQPDGPVVATEPPPRPWSGKTRWIGHC